MKLADAPKDILQGLYDLFREPVVTNFSDDKPRDMSRVIIIGTGNAGKEWFDSIPHNLPEHAQLKAMLDIYAEQ